MNNTTQNKLADMFSKQFEEYNTEVLKKLAEVIKKFDGLTYSQAYQLANQLKYDRSYIDLVNELSKLTGKSKKEIKKVLEETVKQHTEFANTFFKARNMETPVYENDLYLKELVNSVAKVSEGDFTNLAKSTGFAFLDKNNHIQFLNMRDTYYRVIDECVYAISEGKATYGESIKKIIRQLSDSGVRRIVYANDGKKQYTQRIDTAVRRNVLDSIREISIETQKEFGKRFNADGVEVTVHENPAPDHMNVQGHQFTNEEFEKFQNDEDCIDVNGIEFPAISDETGRDRRSIGEYNCYHTILSIIVGVSKPLYSKEELEQIKEKATEKIDIDGKEYTRYETTQLQRGIETEIRYAKDRHMMYKEVNDRNGMLDEQSRITQLTRKYKEISNKAGIREQLNRASVSGYRPIKIKEENADNIIKISKEEQLTRISYRKEYLEEELAKTKEKVDYYANEQGNRAESMYKIYKADYNKHNKEYTELINKEVKDKIIKLETPEDCQELLKEINIDLKDKDIEKVDKEVLINNTKKYYETVKKYPFLEQSLQEKDLKLEYKQIKVGGTIGQATKGGRTIELDVDNFDDIERARYWGEYQSSNGYNMPCSSKDYENYFATHELGHVFNYRIINNVEFPELGDLGATEFYGKTNEFFKDKIFAIARKNTGKSIEELESLVSDYGKTNIDELMAELFANANCGKPNELGKAFEEYFKELLK